MKYLGEAIAIILLCLFALFWFDPGTLGHNARVMIDSFNGWVPCAENALACYGTGEVRR